MNLIRGDSSLYAHLDLPNLYTLDLISIFYGTYSNLYFLALFSIFSIGKVLLPM